jgi:CheY-like chemotaxis protein
MSVAQITHRMQLERKMDTPDPRRTVLVVEDDAQSQLYMRILLSRSYDVIIAGSGNEAWLALEDHPVDVVLMDLSLRDNEDGLMLTRRIRSSSRRSGIPVIAVTAHAFPGDRQRCTEAGCDDYVAKPFTWTRLLELIRHYLTSAGGTGQFGPDTSSPETAFQPS